MIQNILYRGDAYRIFNEKFTWATDVLTKKQYFDIFLS